MHFKNFPSLSPGTNRGELELSPLVLRFHLADKAGGPLCTTQRTPATKHQHQVEQGGSRGDGCFPHFLISGPFKLLKSIEDPKELLFM